MKFGARRERKMTRLPSEKPSGEMSSMSLFDVPYVPVGKASVLSARRGALEARSHDGMTPVSQCRVVSGFLL